MQKVRRGEINRSKIMTYNAVKYLKPSEFKRLCGVQPETFEAMMSVIRQVELEKPPGRPSKLSLENQLLMTLEYWREYRTYFHIGQSWGVNESTAYRIIRKIEDTLVSSRAFTLPGKKKLQQSNHQLEVVVLDVTETPIERPKKNKNSSTAAKRKDIH